MIAAQRSTTSCPLETMPIEKYNEEKSLDLIMETVFKCRILPKKIEVFQVHKSNLIYIGDINGPEWFHLISFYYRYKS